MATILGRNGAGKTTTLRTIMGLVPVTKGFIKFNAKEITNRKPYRIARMGVGYVPEERAVFPSLSVYENLTLPMARGREGRWSLEKIYSFFPILKVRGFHRGSQLSGGEQQMLVIARILTMNVKLIILDEPTEGVLAAPIQNVRPLMGMDLLVDCFVVVVIGGMGSLGGSVVGGLIVGQIIAIGVMVWPPMANTLIYFFMAAFLLVRPRGLFGREAFHE